MKLGKAPGENGITAALLRATGDPGVKWLKRIFDAAWREGEVPLRFRTATLYPIYKKGDRTDCDNYRGIALLDVTGKVLARILADRLAPWAEGVLAEAQCGFRRGRRAADQVFALRMLIEKAVKKGRPLHICFVDLEKAYDSVKRENMWRILELHGVPLRIRNLIKSLHEGNRARVRVDATLSAEFIVERGLRQGCVLAPLLFNVYLDHVLRVARREGGIGVAIKGREEALALGPLDVTGYERRVLNELLYADDMALIAMSVRELQSAVNAFNQVAKRYDLTISIKKTKILHVGETGQDPIKVGGEELESVDSFAYLGSTLAADGSLDQEVIRRISKAAAAFRGLNTRLWKRKEISACVKIAVYRAAILPRLLYGAETWTPLRAHIRRLEAFQMSCMRRILGIRRTDHRRNIEIRAQAKQEHVECALERMRLRWYGHLVRMDKSRVPRVLADFEFELRGNGKRGAPPKSFIDSVQSTVRRFSRGGLQCAGDRGEWRKRVDAIIGRLGEHLNSREEAEYQKRKHREDVRDGRAEPNSDFNHACAVCQRVFDSERGLKIHVAKMHREHEGGATAAELATAREPDEQHRCAHCGFATSSRRGLKQHITKKHGRLYCQACDHVARSERGLKRHTVHSHEQ